METKIELINEGVAKIKGMGFMFVNPTNIFHNEIYSAYFENMLLTKMNKSPYLNAIIGELRKDIKLKS